MHEMLAPKDVLEFASRLADLADKISSSFFRSGVEIDQKIDESPVTIADKKIEREVRNLITETYADHSILGEEYGAGDLTRDHVWVIDPIDGTRSFISGHPLYGFLLAHIEKGFCLLGMISMPELNERFVGQKGLGATLNGKPITASSKTNLSDAIIYINEADKLIQHEPDAFKQLLEVGHTRRFAYDCYPHALLAAGQVDVVVDYDLKPFDFLPLAGVVEEAGGIISDWEGKSLNFESDGRVLSAATPELHKEILATINLGRQG